MLKTYYIETVSKHLCIDQKTYQDCIHGISKQFLRTNKGERDSLIVQGYDGLTLDVSGQRYAADVHCRLLTVHWLLGSILDPFR